VIDTDPGAPEANQIGLPIYPDHVAEYAEWYSIPFLSISASLAPEV
jgi:hypothetical protein